MVSEDGDLLLSSEADWQQLRPPSTTTIIHHHKLLLLPQPPPEMRSLVVIKDSLPPDSLLLNNNNNNNNDNNGVSIFPPINHENLHLYQNHQDDPCFFHPQKSIDPEFDPPPLIKPDPPLIEPDPSSQSSSIGINADWLAFLLQVFMVKVWRSSLHLYEWGCSKVRIFKPFWSLLFSPHVSAVAFAALLWWLFRRRATRLDRLMIGIKERDEKIMHLLTRIVQMNEALLSHQKVSALKSTN